jgi:hypothetical protein
VLIAALNGNEAQKFRARGCFLGIPISIAAR